MENKLLMAIDPGPHNSAFIFFDGATVAAFGIELNASVAARVAAARGTHLAIEMIASYGMPVGKEVFDTCVWIGRFLAAHGDDSRATLVYRKDVKMSLCGTLRATDANIRQALIDLYGPTREKAIGKKSAPGPLYGVSKDVWSALAVAETFRKMRESCTNRVVELRTRAFQA